MSGRVLRTGSLIVAVALGALATSATCGAAVPDSVNKVFGAIRINAGQHRGDLRDVNGSIQVGSDARVGNVTTVNGHISLGPRTTAESMKTINGGTRIGAAAHITGSVSTVNGSVILEQDAEVSGDLSNINGRIQLTGAHVGGEIRTTNGDVNVGADSRVDGGIAMRRAHGRNGGLLDWLFDYHPRIPRIVIGPGAVVTGSLRFENEVRLYVSDSASIGTVEGATAIRFSTDHPLNDDSL